MDLARRMGTCRRQGPESRSWHFSDSRYLLIPDRQSGKGHGGHSFSASDVSVRSLPLYTNPGQNIKSPVLIHFTAELIGWAGRTWSSQCPYNGDAFLMQISTLIIAPTFFTAGIYILLGNFIKHFGSQSSILRPSLYLWIFCTCDVISLVVQAIGGGMASSESSKINGNTDPGTYIMVGGIVFQLVSITIFVACAADFVRRSVQQGLLARSSRSLVVLFTAMLFSVLCIYVRSIYRTIELIQGWDGYLITRQKYFIALDGAMMVAAVAVFNFCHPAWLMPSTRPPTIDWENLERKGQPAEDETELFPTAPYQNNAQF